MRAFPHRLAVLGVLLAILTHASLGLAAEGTADFRPADWLKRRQTEHFVLYYTDRGADAVSDSLVRQAARAMESAYDRLVTRGHLPPPLQKPFPVVVAPDDPSDQLGLTRHEDLGYKQHIFLNTRLVESTTFEEVAAHELFHAIQFRVLGWAPDAGANWLVEGTAVTASLLAYLDTPEVRRSVLDGHLSTYWWDHPTGLFAAEYAASLFWYDLARRYGGMDFLSRLLTYGSSYDFRQAAQLAAIAGKAPDDTSFDSLFRQFVLDLGTGAIALDYPEEGPGGQLLVDDAIWWDGETRTLENRPTGGAGLDWNQNPYSYRARLRVNPYAFNLYRLNTVVDQPLNLTFKGEPGMQLFLFQTQAADATQVIRLQRGETATLRLTADSRVLAAVVRYGNFGLGNFTLGLAPAAASAPATATAATAAAALVADGKDGPTAGSPPPVSPQTLTALKKGTLALQAQLSAGGDVVAYVNGQASALLRDRSVPLAAKPYWADGDGDKVLMVPASGLAAAGAVVSLGRTSAVISRKEFRVTVSADSALVSATGWSAPLPARAAMQNNVLMVPVDVLSYLGLEMGSYSGTDDYRIFFL